MLIPTKVLRTAIREFHVRNKLIDQLTRDKNELYNLVLAFWLGSNITLFEIQQKTISNESYRCIYAIYFCFLILDRKMSEQIAGSPACKALEQCMQEFMEFYNQNYVLLTENPGELFSKLKSIIEKLDETLARQPKQLCLNELNRPLSQDVELMKQPLQETAWIPSLSWRSNLNRIITPNAFRLRPFHMTLSLMPNIVYQKIFLKAKGGVIIDGLVIKDVNLSSDTVVLALIGMFQTEENYFSYNALSAFYNLFRTDILFINHRNFSLRSHRTALNNEELAKDVIQFAEYFMQQGKKIVLYGMCGGGAQMILAADMLRRNNKTFKLIVDRSFSTYSQFVGLKTLERNTDAIKFFGSKIASECNQFRGFKQLEKMRPGTLKNLIAKGIPLLLNVLVRSVIYASGNTLDFGKILRDIPSNDVLVLQAKSKKRKDYREPEYTDLTIHPESDLRFTVKNIRQQNKRILRNLIEDCQNILFLYTDSQSFQKVFQDLVHCFENYLKLIDNEKLRCSWSSTNPVNEIHHHRLYDLTTRHDLPMGQFIRGFFAEPQQSCDATLRNFNSFSFRDVWSGLQALHPRSKMELSDIAIPLDNFLTAIKKHEVFICYVGNRLNATGLSNMNDLLQKFMASDLYVAMTKAKNKREQDLKNIRQCSI